MKIVIHTELFAQVENKKIQKNSTNKRKFVINYLIPLSGSLDDFHPKSIWCDRQPDERNGRKECVQTVGVKCK